jgi:hypothetical protein
MLLKLHQEVICRISCILPLVFKLFAQVRK